MSSSAFATAIKIAPTRPSCLRVQIAAIVAVGLCAMAPLAVANDEQEHASPAALLPPTLTLVTHWGDRIAGHWLAAENFETIHWQADGFVEPFRFDRQNLSAIQFHHTTEASPLTGAYHCELASGDVLRGTPVSLDDEELVFAIPNIGHVRIDRRHLRRLTPRHPTNETVSRTPHALDDWQGEQDHWQEAVGQITAKADQAVLTTTLSIGNKSCLSLAFAWEAKPNFRIDFGSGPKGNWGLRLEAWEDRLVFVVESAEEADILLVKKLGNHADALTLNFFIDAHEKKIVLAAEDGYPLGQFDWQGKYENNFRILARKKGFQFRGATVTPWNGDSPVPHDANRTSVNYKDGKTVPASITAWDAESQEWVFAVAEETPNETKTEPEERRVAGDVLKSLAFGVTDFDETSAKDFASVQAISRNGMRFNGRLFKFSKDAVWLSCRGIQEPLILSLSKLESLVFLRKSDSKKVASPDAARLSMEGISMVGQLVDGHSTQQASALVWKPEASQNALAIANDASGTIVYRDPPPPIAKKNPEHRPQNHRGIRRRGALGGMVRLLSKPLSPESNKSASSKKSPLGSTLYLRFGDSIPCQPKHIDAKGVTFTSSVTDATFAPHQAIKALVLVNTYQPARVTKEQRDRLLTLPRMQQEYPPTHLLLSIDGDLLRTRLLAVDDEFITTEVRLNTLTIPRAKVAAIAWLQPSNHNGDSPEENQPEENNAEKAPADIPNPTFRVQTVQTDGIRLTFYPQHFSDGILVGESDVFGNCRVPLSQVDKVLFGNAINEDLQYQSHHLLSLKPAIVPRFLTEDQTTPEGAGQNSSLVGKAAPPIRLKKLDGSKFDLEDQKGKVIVLDFWATWCGPCIQWMPQLEQIVSGYSDEKVELITVNLLEDKRAIEEALERMQIDPTVLLDTDGTIANAYQATAIPQTVIIDQQGQVHRLFIGSSAQIKQPLIEALEALTREPEVQHGIGLKPIPEP